MIVFVQQVYFFFLTPVNTISLCYGKFHEPVFFFLVDPWLWNESQVCQWLVWAASEFSLKTVNFQKFIMTGQELCSLGKELFLELAPDFVGDILWEHLEQMMKGNYQAHGQKVFYMVPGTGLDVHRR